MFTIHQNALKHVSAACSSNACAQATLDMLAACDMDALYQINQIFKGVLLNPNMQDADAETKRAALIAAISTYSFV